MTLTIEQPARHRSHPLSVDPEATKAGLIVWLAGRRMPNICQYDTLDQVDRFLLWYDTQYRSSRPNPRAAVWSYLAEMRAAELGEAMMAEIWAALSLFLDYWDQRTLEHGMRERPRPAL